MDENINLEKKIIEANIKLSARESSNYDFLHPTLFNFYQAGRTRNEVNFICNQLLQNYPFHQCSILDIGCGTGRLIFKFLEKSDHFNITGVDLSKEILEVLSANFKKINKPSLNIELVPREAIEYLKQARGKYDVVAMSALLHHLADFTEFINLASAATKEEGVIYVAFEPLKQPIKSKTRFFFHRAIRAVDNFLFQMRLKQAGVKFNRDSLENLANYQRGLGGIEPEKITDLLEGNNLKIILLNRFSVRNNGILAWLSDKIIRTENSFSIIAQKNKNSCAA